jgi:hypothetical protein
MLSSGFFLFVDKTSHLQRTWSDARGKVNCTFGTCTELEIKTGHGLDGVEQTCSEPGSGSFQVSYERAARAMATANATATKI